VRYEGLVQTFDRRPQAEIDANIFRGPIRRTLAILLPWQRPKGPKVKKTSLPAASKMTVPVPTLPVGQVAATPVSVG